MLLDDETENQVGDVLAAVSQAYLFYLTGRTVLRSAGSLRSMLTQGSRLTVLESAYVAGKIANVLGPDKLKRMTEQQLQDWLSKSDVNLTDVDTVTLANLKRDTDRYMAGRAEAWKTRMRTELSKADREWATAVASKVYPDSFSLVTARNAALSLVKGAIGGILDSVQDDAKRVVETEMSSYFQRGQIAGEDQDQLVYKIPRLTACKYCLDLHLNPDGSPKMYRLGDVAGNSNIGLPAYAWDFTIGPVHPHCYCVLHFADREPAEADEDRAEAVRDSRRGLRKSLNSCGISEDDSVLFEEQLQKVTAHEHGEHMEVLAKALKALQGKSEEPLPPG